MRVVISNTVILNGGDAAILLAIIKLIREAFGSDTECSISESQPSVAARYYPGMQLYEMPYKTLPGGDSNRKGRIRNRIAYHQSLRGAALWRRGYRAAARVLSPQAISPYLDIYGSADLICSTGGTYLVENYDLRSRIFDFEFSLALGRPLVLFTQSLGPFRDPTNRARLRPIFDRCNLVLLRDWRSKKHLHDLNVSNPNLVVAPDSVFALADPDKLAKPERAIRGAPARIAISVRDWAHFKSVDASSGNKQYRQAICGLVVHAVRKYRCEVVFLSTCQGIPEYRDDSRVAAAISASLPADIADSVRVDGGFHDPAALLRMMTEYDLVIATRMHFAILALCAGVPVLPIEYEFKTRELFESLQHEEFVIDIETVSEESLIGMFERIAGNLASIRGALCQAVGEQHRRAMGSAQLLRDAWKPKGDSRQ